MTFIKRQFFILFLIISLILGGVKYIYDVFDSLKSEIANLKSINKTLSSKNKSLQKKQNQIKQKLQDRRKHLVQSKLQKAKGKLAKAPATMVPIAGAALIVGYTTYEIRELCEDVQEYKSFENSLFENSDKTISEDEQLLCGLNVEDELLLEIKKYSQASSSWLSENYEALSKELENYLDLQPQPLPPFVEQLAP